MEKVPKVSVIIPAYNMGEYIGEAIESVLEDELDGVEIIVIDDGSTDSTRYIVNEYSDKQNIKDSKNIIYKCKKNGGKATAVNVGIKKSKGRYIAILDADDQLAENSLYKRYSHIKKEENCIAVGGFEVFRRGKSLGKREAPSCTSTAVLRRKFYLSYKTPFSLNNCLIPRQLVNKTGLFDPELKRCQDIDYAIRLLSNSKCVVSVNNVVYRYRKHRNSISGRVVLRVRTLYYRSKVMRKNFGGIFGLFVIIYTIFIDVIKIFYEMIGVYKK
jgi:glycosyltransferase involved in cell wall biosynthesis